jgi:aminoglycoside 3-N-acetyltransferase
MPSTEGEAVTRSPTPVTSASLAADLRALGVRADGVLIVHSSLSKLGWVVGGAQAVVLALQSVVGEAGTLVLPTHSGHLSDPANWENPPVPSAWWPGIRADMPAYDSELTPTREMGAIVECFRHVPGVVRSSHPRHSFAALGPAAETIVADHDLADSFGEQTPLGRAYELDAQVLLLGVGHANNTSLHLAEARGSFTKKRYRNGSPVIVDGRREWVSYEGDDTDDADFETLGAAFARTGAQHEGSAGHGTAKLMSQRAVVDFAVDWMNANRP